MQELFFGLVSLDGILWVPDVYILYQKKSITFNLRERKKKPNLPKLGILWSIVSIV